MTTRPNQIIRNSAKCTACGAEIESTNRHDFKIHKCPVEPTDCFRFGVDGGKDYIRRIGGGFEDTSEYGDA